MANILKIEDLTDNELLQILQELPIEKLFELSEQILDVCFLYFFLKCIIQWFEYYVE